MMNKWTYQLMEEIEYKRPKLKIRNIAKRQCEYLSFRKMHPM